MLAGHTLPAASCCVTGRDDRGTRYEDAALTTTAHPGSPATTGARASASSGVTRSPLLSRDPNPRQQAKDRLHATWPPERPRDPFELFDYRL